MTIGGSWFQRSRGSWGFTLIELLIVVVVLGILSGIVLFAVGSARSEATASRCAADVRTIQGANEAYKADNGSDAPDVSALVSGHYLKSAPTSGVTFSGGVTNPASAAACTGSLAFTPTPSTPQVHLASITGTATHIGNGVNWSSSLTVSVVDDGANPVSGAAVSGSWSDGVTPAGCTTGSGGTCTIATSAATGQHSSASATWSVSAVTKAGYDSGANSSSSISCSRPAGNGATEDCS